MTHMNISYEEYYKSYTFFYRNHPLLVCGFKMCSLSCYNYVFSYIMSKILYDVYNTEFFKVLINVPFLTDNKTQQEFIEYAFLSLGLPVSSISPTELALWINVYRYKDRGIPLTPELQQFKDHMDLLASNFEKYKATKKNFNLTQYLLDNSVK